MLLRKRKPTDSVLADKKSAVAITCAILFPVLIGMLLLLLRVGLLYYYSELVQMSLDGAATSVALVSSVGSNGMKNTSANIYPIVASCIASTIFAQNDFFKAILPASNHVNATGLDSYNRLHLSYTVSGDNFSVFTPSGNTVNPFPFMKLGSLTAHAVVPQFLDPYLNPKILVSEWYQSSLIFC